MNNWKTISFQKKYSYQRLFIISSFTMISCFLFLYVPITTYFAHNKLTDDYFILFLISLFFMYPVHKMLHYLPVIHVRDKIKTTIEILLHFVPFIRIRISEPIGKYHFLFTLITPFIIINSLLLVLCYIYTNSVHFFLLLFAYHLGICVPDFIRIKNVWNSPKACYVEENETGFDILINIHKPYN